MSYGQRSTGSVLADAPKSKNAKVTLVYEHELPNVPGKSLRAVLVEYGPDGGSPSHRHPSSAFIYARVLEGAIRSKVNDAPERTYQAGESWTEQPSLDALAAGSPIVNIAFDVTPTPRELSAARFYDYSHYKPIVESGAVRVAYNQDDFFASVNAYLADRTLDQQRRYAARNWFMTFTDGSSAERIATAICQHRAS